MAFVTYILLAALNSGLNSRFHPEILGVTASKALAVVLLDFIFVKGGCYFLNIQVRLPFRLGRLPFLTFASRIRDRAKCWICSRMMDTSLLGTSSMSLIFIFSFIEHPLQRHSHSIGRTPQRRHNTLPPDLRLRVRCVCPLHREYSVVIH